MKSINLNDTVKVKLTDHGKDIFYHQYDELNESLGKQLISPCFPRVDEEGFTKMQLWQLMKLYGPYIDLGKENPFEQLRIYFEDGVLQDHSLN